MAWNWPCVGCVDCGGGKECGWPACIACLYKFVCTLESFIPLVLAGMINVSFVRAISHDRSIGIEREALSFSCNCWRFWISRTNPPDIVYARTTPECDWPCGLMVKALVFGSEIHQRLCVRIAPWSIDFWIRYVF